MTFRGPFGHIAMQMSEGQRKVILKIDVGFRVKYGTFDILSDEEVRQGLKTFSNWPTYPQLYVKGELIGGLDIVKVMLKKHSRAISV